MERNLRLLFDPSVGKFVEVFVPLMEYIKGDGAGDPRCVDAATLKTILRQPVKPSAP